MTYLDDYDIKEPYEIQEKSHRLWHVIRFLLAIGLWCWALIETPIEWILN